MTTADTTVPPPPTLRSLSMSVYLPTFLFGVGQGAVIPILALAAIDLGASVPEAGFIVALRGIGTMAFDVPAGSLVARIGERRAMVAATVALFVSLVGCVASPSLLLFAVCTFLMGCAWSIWLLARLSYVTDVMPGHLRGRALSTLGGVNRIGNFVGPFVGAGAIHLWSIDGAFFVHIVSAAVGCVVLVLVGDPHVPTTVDHRPVRLITVGREHRRVFLTAGLAATTICVLRASRQVVLPLWAVHIGLDSASVGIIFGLSSAMDMTLFYPVGLASDRWGRRAVAVPCLVILALGHLLVPLTDNFTTLALVGTLMGFGNGLGSGIVMTLGADFSPPNGRAEFLGAFRFLGDAGTAGGPLLVAAATAALSVGAASGIVGGIGLLGAAMVLLRMPSPPVDLERAAAARSTSSPTVSPSTTSAGRGRAGTS